MKVLMVGPDRSVHGGISGVVNNYYEAGLDKKIELDYIGTMVDGSQMAKLMQAMKAFCVFIARVWHCDIVHVNVASDMSYYRKSVFIRAAHFFRRRIVIHQHGGDFQTFYYRKLGEKGRKKVQKVFGMADVFMVLTPAWKTFFEKIVAEEKIVVLPNAIAIPAEVPKIYGQHKALFLGRLCRDKGILELLEAALQLKQKYPDFQLYLGGVWEDERLAEKAQECSEAVQWLGWISGEEKEKYLSLCDIFVLPSYFEGQPVSVLEAMAASCAVVAADVGGIPFMVTNEENGILIKPRSRESLQQGIERILKDDDLCKRLGENARQRVSQDFSIEQNINRLLQIYEGVLK